MSREPPAASQRTLHRPVASTWTHEDEEKESRETPDDVTARDISPGFPDDDWDFQAEEAAALKNRRVIRDGITIRVRKKPIPLSDIEVAKRYREAKVAALTKVTSITRAAI